jgi:hypothetical protein
VIAGLPVEEVPAGEGPYGAAQEIGSLVAAASWLSAEQVELLIAHEQHRCPGQLAEHPHQPVEQRVGVRIGDLQPGATVLGAFTRLAQAVESACRSTDRRAATASSQRALGAALWRRWRNAVETRGGGRAAGVRPVTILALRERQQCPWRFPVTMRARSDS